MTQAKERPGKGRARTLRQMPWRWVVLRCRDTHLGSGHRTPKGMPGHGLAHLGSASRKSESPSPAHVSASLAQPSVSLVLGESLDHSLK